MDRAERTGFAIALAGHVALFGALSLGLLATPKPLPPMNDPIDVQLVDAIAPRSAAPEISQEAPAPAAAPEAGPPEEAAPAPEPDDAPPERQLPPPAPRLTPKPAPPQAIKPAPLPKPVPPKPAPAKAAPAKSAPAKTVTKAPAKPGAGSGKRSAGGIASDDFLKGITPEKSAGRAQTPRAAMTGAQANALAGLIREQLKPFWTPPAGTGVDELVTTLRVRLNKDGSLAGSPEVVETRGTNASNKGYVRQHQDAAKRAVLRAAPIKRLPAEFYEDWKMLDTNFDNRLSG